jgi:hypothetical protein
MSFRTYTDADLLTFTVRSYKEGGMWGKRKLGPNRYALDFGHVSLIFEFWWIRDRRPK